MKNKYAEELEKERGLLKNRNPFNKNQGSDKRLSRRNPRENPSKEEESSRPYIPHKKNENSNYFSLILSSEYNDLEMDIRGLRPHEVKGRDGKIKIIYRRRANHFLSEDGAEDLLLELRTHLHPDIKLAIFSRDEFLCAMDAIRKHFLSFICNNLYTLGMDTEPKQRNAPVLANRILLRIRAVYSRSVAGIENQRSHGDIKLSGNLDLEKEEKFDMEELKN